MTIIRIEHNKNNPYVILNRSALEDENLSWAAKGLWAYLMSRPDDWNISVAHLSSIYEDKGGGERAIYSILKELIKNGYCQRNQKVGKKGQFGKYEYIITEFKNKVPHCSQADAAQADALESATNNNRTITSNEYKKDNVPLNPPIQKKDNGETMTFKQKDQDNVFDESLPSKYKLNDDQKETFRYLKTLSIDSDDNTLCWWAKNYSLVRILEVYKASEGKKSIGAYMNKLLKVQANVAKVHSQLNIDFAQDYKNKSGWHDLKIGKLYVTFLLGNDTQELSLNMEPLSFAEHLIRKHESISEMNRGNYNDNL